MDFLRYNIDRYSFWIGFAAGILFTLFIVQLRLLIPRLVRSISSQIDSVRKSLTTESENRLRNDVLNLAQRKHLTSMMFSLDEILIEPRLLSPPVLDDEDPSVLRDAIQFQTIPYMPDWPEMGSYYNSPKLTLPQAMQGGANLMIIAQPGMGKTVALAHLASLVARQDESASDLRKMIPCLVHAADLLGKLDERDPAGLLISAVSAYASKIIMPRLPGMIRRGLEDGSILLLIDGADEFSPDLLQTFKKYLSLLLTHYAGLRVVIAASPENYGGLHQLGLLPMALASWSRQDQVDFVNQWSENWTHYIEPEELASSTFTDPLLLTHWLSAHNPGGSPLELTLKAWAAFAGDITSPDLASLLDAYFLRMTTNIPNARLALERLASQIIINQKPVFSQHEAAGLVSKFAKSIQYTQAIDSQNADPGKPEETTETFESDEHQPGEEVLAEQPAAEKKPKDKKKGPKRLSQTGYILDDLTSAGLLLSHPNSQLTLNNPLFTSYLAGNALAQTENFSELVGQPTWSGKWLTIGFAGSLRDISEIVTSMINQSASTPLQIELLAAGRWLQNSAKTAPWRSTIMRSLAALLQKESRNLPLCFRIVTALALSGETGIGPLFRQLLKSNQDILRQVAALGAGLIGDVKAVNDLYALTDDPTLTVGRAACLSLVSIGNKSAVDGVITTLLNGTEELRRAAAEALTNHPAEGYPILKEAITMDDLLVRRAVIFGLMRVNEPWVIPLFEKVAVEDGQWVVRNAATEALDELRGSNPYIPQPAHPLVDTPWVIKFAGKQGVGVKDEKQGTELVINAIERGDNKERMQALFHLRGQGDEIAVAKIYHAYFGSTPEVRDACYLALWHIAASGVNLPATAQYGLG